MRPSRTSCSERFRSASSRWSAAGSHRCSTRRTRRSTCRAWRYWDNLAVSRFFGAGGVGVYNMAYNLADIPAIQVGEQIALVLLPSMTELPPERRAAALERASALLSIIIFPLAIGLGLVAEPLIAALLPADKWQGVAPLLTVLSVLSVFRPISWVLSADMEAEAKTKRLMFLEIAK